jgi:hypothetical protein
MQAKLPCETEFKQLVMKRFGYGKENLSKAFEVKLRQRIHRHSERSDDLGR